ncbi:MAG TPA: hypothetical protein VFG05_13840 [Methylocella sp.]|nr:hypothetical protein [Methylocella sp.]
MSALRMFIPITKVDAPQRLVYGVATAEKEDRAGEICDYESTKPFYEKWSDEIKRSSGGKSLGNLRAMHGPVAAGKVVAITFNDAAKQIEICAKVVDDAEWSKVQEGVYTGFSQGGTYERRWTDTEGRTRYTAAPNEISLVDLPCLPQATFEMIKADGTSERHSFAIAGESRKRLESLIEELDWLKDAAEISGTDGEDDAVCAGELANLAGRVSMILRALAARAAAEGENQGAAQREAQDSTASLRAGAAAAARSRGKAQIGTPNRARAHPAHDASVQLASFWGSQKAAAGELEKRFDALAETLADVQRRVKNIEEQPLPLPYLGHARAVSKGADGLLSGHESSAAEELLSNPEALSVLAIKLAQRNGRSPLR